MTSVGTIIGGGFGLIRERPVAVAIWFALQFVVSLGTQILFVRQFADASASSYAMPDSAAIGSAGGLVLVGILMAIVLVAAGNRAILRPGESAFGYLRLGMDELRLLGLAVILIVVGCIGAVIAMLLLTLLAVGFSMAFSGAPALAIGLVVLLYVAMIAGAIFLWVRLSLVVPLTLLRRKIVIDGSWELTKGRFWLLFAAYLVLWIVTFILYAAVTLPFMGSYFAELAQAAGNPEAMQQLEQAQALRTLNMPMSTLILMTLLSALAQTLALALSAGASATAARELLYDRGEVTEDDVQRTAQIFE